MWLTIDLNSDTPIYTQIRNQVIEGIIKGNINAEDTLPSVRQLASDIGVNLHTVNKAYTLLKQEGFIQIHRQKGAVVNSPECYKADKDYYLRAKEEIRPVIAESFCRGVTKEEFFRMCEEIYLEYGKKTEGDK